MRPEALKTDSLVSDVTASEGQVPFSDPKGETFPWAASLRPQNCGSKPKNRAIASWVISAVAEFNMTRRNTLCIVGSRVLQRIIAIRYLKSESLEAGREYYQTVDTDIWVRSSSSRTMLVDALKQTLLRVPGVSISSQAQSLFSADIVYQPVSIYSVTAEDVVDPKSSGTFLGKVDISNPMRTDGDIWEKFHKVILEAERLPMADSVSSDLGQYAVTSTLTDLNYLKLQRKTLETLRKPAHDKDMAARDKITQVTLPLLVYMELTRYLFDGNKPDDFTIELFRMFYEFVPEKSAELSKVLSEQFPDQWKMLQGIQPPVIPKISYAMAVTAWSQTPETQKEESPPPSSPQLMVRKPGETSIKNCSQPAIASKKKSSRSVTKSAASYSSSSPTRQDPGEQKAASEEIFSDTITLPQQEEDTENRGAKLAEDVNVESLQSTRVTQQCNQQQTMASQIDTSLDSIPAALSDTGDEQALFPMPKTPTTPSASEAATEISPDLAGDTSVTTPVLSSDTERAGKTAYDRIKNILTEYPSPKYKSWKPGEAALTAHLLTMETSFPSPRGDGKEISRSWLFETSRRSSEKTDPQPKNNFEMQLQTFKEILSPLQLVKTCCTNSAGRYPVIILSEEGELRQRALMLLERTDLKNIPYADYLCGLLKLDCNAKKQRQEDGYHLLFSAAKSGVTGAAFELLRKSLTVEKFPIPVSCIMQLLRACLERPESRQLAIHFHHSPVRPPYDVADIVIATIKKEAAYPLSQEVWQTIGEQLKQTAATLSLPNWRERCLLTAACSFNIAEQPDNALACHDKIGKKTVRKMTSNQHLDWFIQGLPSQLYFSCACKTKSETGEFKPSRDDISLSEPIDNNPTVRLIVDALIQDAGSFSATLEKVPVSSLWYEWVPYCFSENHDYEWLSSLPELKSHWKRVQRLRAIGDIRAHGKVGQEIDSPYLQKGGEDIFPKKHPAGKAVKPLQPQPPLRANKITNILNEDYPNNAEKISRGYKGLDKFLLIMLGRISKPAVHDIVISTSDPLTSLVIEGCQITVNALDILGASISITSPGTIDIQDICSEKLNKAKVLLAEAISEYGNPYACWIYARLLRSELVNYLSLPEIEKQWYGQYLSLMVFAATMGIAGAANDLLAELIEGRADGLLMTITALIGRRYRKSRVFVLNFNFEPLSFTHLYQQISSYSIDTNNQAWGEYIEKALSDKNVTASAYSDQVHEIRTVWIHIFLSKALDYSDKPKTRFILPPNLDKVTLPEALQISIAASMEHFDLSTRNLCAEDLIPNFYPAISSIALDMANRNQPDIEALKAHDCEKILLYFSWQPGTFWITEIWKDMSKKSKNFNREELQPVQQLMQFYQCTVQSDLMLRFPDSEEGYMPAVFGWVAMYQLLRAGASVTLTRPSPDLPAQATIVRQFDTLFWRYLNGNGQNDQEFQAVCKILIPIIKNLSGVSESQTVSLMMSSDNAAELLETIRQLPGSIPQNPYLYLLRGMCLEIVNNSSTAPCDITTACVEFHQASMLGCDDAARHLGRLSLTSPNSPVSIERALNAYLIQYMRKRRHCIQLINTRIAKCPPGIEEILNTLDTICLQPSQQAPPCPKSLSVLLQHYLIPALEQLLPGTRSSATRSKLSLMISHCYTLTKQDRVKSLFRMSDAAQVSFSTLHQWKWHINLNMGSGTPALVKWGNTIVPQINNLLQGKELSVRQVPYIPYFSDIEYPHWKLFTDWHERPNSWHELPVFMGQLELDNWRKCMLGFMLDKTKKKAAHRIELPGEKSHEFYLVNVQWCATYAILIGDTLRLPAPNGPDQQEIAQLCYDQYRIEQTYLDPEHTDIPELSAATGGATPAAKKKKKKKKKPSASTDQ